MIPGSLPARFGNYVLLEEINSGGMAVVHKAKAFGAAGFEKIVAIKRILPFCAKDKSFIDMFIDEARLAVQLSDPNIVEIYELGRIGDQFYIAMEYVPGQDLRRLLERLKDRDLRLPLPCAAYIAYDAYDTLFGDW